MVRRKQQAPPLDRRSHAPSRRCRDRRNSARSAGLQRKRSAARPCRRSTVGATPPKTQQSNSARLTFLRCVPVQLSRPPCPAGITPRWRGSQVLRAMLRARTIASREAGKEETRDGLLEVGRREGLDLAGYRLGAAMIAELETAQPPELSRQAKIAHADIGGAACGSGPSRTTRRHRPMPSPPSSRWGCWYEPQALRLRLCRCKARRNARRCPRHDGAAARHRRQRDARRGLFGPGTACRRGSPPPAIRCSASTAAVQATAKATTWAFAIRRKTLPPPSQPFAPPAPPLRGSSRWATATRRAR